MLSERSAQLLTALRRTFPRWECAVDGDRVQLTYGQLTTPYRPPRRVPYWPELLAVLTESCTTHGIRSCPPLPLHGLGDAELTFSAVQGLDPYLKSRLRHTHAHGFVAQPVVRFTGQRDAHGKLLPGFLTSFVNTSIIEPIHTVDEHTTLLDTWVGALSALGFHARHLTISGSLAVWYRDPVGGVTLHVHHQDRELGDAVLLWNQADPTKLATDIGSGLERLAWLRSGRSWAEVIYGPMAGRADPSLLDPVRTTTLLVGNGIRPASRGPGSAVRRLLHGQVQGLGLSRVVRWAHAYWCLFDRLPVAWPDVCRMLESEIDRATQARRCD